jgi:16S rRNA (adenine(1408)-N(1))-methyltransferase
METIRGRTPCTLDLTELHERLANHSRVILDLGTGDGKFALHYARTSPNHFVIGVDSCRENLRELSRAKQPNLLFLIANAQSLPHELNGLVSHITINFPWGSLLESLLNGDPCLMRGLKSVSRSCAGVNVRLNGGALAEAGTTLEHGAQTIFNNLLQAGWQIEAPVIMDACSLHKFHSTWAKRLAFGRDPRAMTLSGNLK